MNATSPNEVRGHLSNISQEWSISCDSIWFLCRNACSPALSSFILCSCRCMVVAGGLCTFALIGWLKNLSPPPKDALEPLFDAIVFFMEPSASTRYHEKYQKGDHGSKYFWYPTNQPVCGHRCHFCLYPTSEGKLSLNACILSIVFGLPKTTKEPIKKPANETRKSRVSRTMTTVSSIWTSHPCGIIIHRIFQRIWIVASIPFRS